MSWSVDLLIVSEKTLREIANDISYMMNLPVTRLEGDDEGYFLTTLGAQLVVGENYLVNDCDLIFESYDVIVSIWSTKLPDWETSEEECRSVGATLFEKMRETYRTNLLLTENVQKRLLTFDPAL